jgi:probable F420-dependent oxidoreductase
VKVDGMLPGPLAASGVQAAELEAAGYAGGWTFEVDHDPFLPLAVAAPHTAGLELGTSIAVAFARSPMTLAYTAWDLQAASGGRFVLGLGSQIKPHITKRFSMPWTHPAPRMRELILALRAIWDSWLTGARLQFRGEFYTHTLMTPFFTPSAADLDGIGVPRVFLAGVGAVMTEVAGEVADGFICHAFTTERYLREVTLPALARGRAKAGKTLDGFEISGPSFLVTGADGDERAAADRDTRRRIAFYGSTPAYRAVLELHGWGALQGELNALSKAGEWERMADLIDDDVLSAFAVVAEPEDVASRLAERFGDVVTRITLDTAAPRDPERRRELIGSISAV